MIPTSKHQKIKARIRHHHTQLVNWVAWVVEFLMIFSSFLWAIEATACGNTAKKSYLPGSAAVNRGPASLISPKNLNNSKKNTSNLPQRLTPSNATQLDRTSSYKQNPYISDLKPLIRF